MWSHLLIILFYNTIGKIRSSLSVRPDRRSEGADFWSQTAFLRWPPSRHNKIWNFKIQDQFLRNPTSKNVGFGPKTGKKGLKKGRFWPKHPRTIFAELLVPLSHLYKKLDLRNQPNSSTEFLNIFLHFPIFNLSSSIKRLGKFGVHWVLGRTEGPRGLIFGHKLHL